MAYDWCGLTSLSLLQLPVFFFLFCFCLSLLSFIFTKPSFPVTSDAPLKPPSLLASVYLEFLSFFFP